MVAINLKMYTHIIMICIVKVMEAVQAIITQKGFLKIYIVMAICSGVSKRTNELSY